MPENTIIEKTFTYDLPDKYLYQTNNLKKTGTFTYKGPDKFWMFVNNETKKVNGRFHYLERDNGADVPTPEGLTKVFVDANENPLMASLIYNEVDYEKELGKTITDLPDGNQYWCPDPTPPDHTYELEDIEYDFETGKFVTPYPWKKPYVTWEELINVRNNMLRMSDMKLRIAAPEKQGEWEDYRQKLRDITTVFEGFDPWMVRFPQEPTE